MTDEELIRDYARHRSERAFAVLVERHLNLVYSVARRHVRSAALAEEVAQLVFIDLARSASQIKADTPLVAWLHLVSRRTAIDVVRREARRRAREHAAAEINAMATPSSHWEAVEPLLDEAVESLPASDRSAVLLRFFENKSLREIGEALGISDDTAQKRVSRALDRMRVFFEQRGIAVGAASLATTLSTHAMDAAPAGLGAAISSSVALTTTLAPTTALAAAKHIVMTSTQKLLLGGALAAAIGAGLYETGVVLRLRRDVQAGERRIASLAANARLADRERRAAARAASGALTDAGRFPAPEPGSDAALEMEIAAWHARVERLKQAIAQRPGEWIPELDLATESDWFSAARDFDLKSEPQLRERLKLLRSKAKTRLGHLVLAALEAHGRDHPGAVPANFAELASLLPPLATAALRARYEVETEPNRIRLSEKIAGAPDADRLYFIQRETQPSRQQFSRFETPVARAVREAKEAYAQANRGAAATQPAQLLPYLRQPVEPAQLAEEFRR